MNASVMAPSMDFARSVSPSAPSTHLLHQSPASTVAGTFDVSLQVVASALHLAD